jgi:hypothetical protein
LRSRIRTGVAEIGTRILKRFHAYVVAWSANHDDRRRRSVGVGLDDQIGAVERELPDLAGMQCGR